MWVVVTVLLFTTMWPFWVFSVGSFNTAMWAWDLWANSIWNCGKLWLWEESEYVFCLCFSKYCLVWRDSVPSRKGTSRSLARLPRATACSSVAVLPGGVCMRKCRGNKSALVPLTSARFSLKSLWYLPFLIIPPCIKCDLSHFLNHWFTLMALSRQGSWFPP